MADKVGGGLKAPGSLVLDVLVSVGGIPAITRWMASLPAGLESGVLLLQDFDEFNFSKKPAFLIFSQKNVNLMGFIDRFSS